MPSPSPVKPLPKKIGKSGGQTSNRDSPSSRRAKKTTKKKTSPRGVDDPLVYTTIVEEEEMTEKLLNEAFDTAPLQQALAPAQATESLVDVKRTLFSEGEGGAATESAPTSARAAAFVDSHPELAESIAAFVDGIVASAPAAVELEAAPAAEVQGWSNTPAAEAQCAVSLAIALNRAMCPANQRVKAFNFDLDALVGFDMQNTTIGVLGDGAAATECAKLMGAFGGKVIRACPAELASGETRLEPVHPFRPTTQFAPTDTVVSMDELCASADIIAVHAPLNATSSVFYGANAIAATKNGAMLITSSAGLIDIEAVGAALETKRLGHLGVISGDVPPGLRTLPNVIAKPALGVNPPTVVAATSAAAANPWAAASVTAGPDTPEAMRVAFFSARPYFTERFAGACDAHNAAKEDGAPPIRFEMHAARLETSSAALAAGCKAVCLFVNDDGSADVLRELQAAGVETVLMRCAGFDKIDLSVAAELGLKVARVPAYSPEAVAQQAVALLLTLKWKLASAGGAPTTASSPLGLNLSGTTVGVLGTGRIGYLFAMIMQGFGCKILAYDPYKNKAIEEAGIPYLTLEEVYAQADVLSLHVPLLPSTKYMINAEAIGRMKEGVTLLNVSRGALIDTTAVVTALQSGAIGAYGTDVYEHESPYFFDDHSSDAEGERDPLLSSLIGMDTVLLTGHQAFLTAEALTQIVGTTMLNLNQRMRGEELKNEVKA